MEGSSGNRQGISCRDAAAGRRCSSDVIKQALLLLPPQKQTTIDGCCRRRRISPLCSATWMRISGNFFFFHSNRIKSHRVPLSACQKKKMTTRPNDSGGRRPVIRPQVTIEEIIITAHGHHHNNNNLAPAKKCESNHRVIIRPIVLLPNAPPLPPPSTPLCTAPQWSNEPPRYANHPDASTRPMERQLGRQQRHSSWRPINSNGREIQNNFESLKVGRTLLIGGFVHDSLLGANGDEKVAFSAE